MNPRDTVLYILFYTGILCNIFMAYELFVMVLWLTGLDRGLFVLLCWVAPSRLVLTLFLASRRTLWNCKELCYFGLPEMN